MVPRIERSAVGGRLSEVVVILAAIAAAMAPGAGGAAELNALVWCDHADPDLLGPFEEANDVTVNVKEYEGTGAGLAIVEQSQPGDWDVMVIDSIDVRRAVERGLFAPLPEESCRSRTCTRRCGSISSPRPTASATPSPRSSATTRSASTKTRSMSRTCRRSAPCPIRNTTERIAIYDYYLPVIGMAALATGKKTAELTAEDLPAIKDVLLQWKANARLVGEVTASQTALATGEADILVGGGEWVTAVLAAENPALDSRSRGRRHPLVAVARHVRGQREPGPRAEVHPVRHEPGGPARLATSSCYWGMPANTKAALSDEQKAVLRFDEQPEFLTRAQFYPAPDEALDKQMQDSGPTCSRPNDRRCGGPGDAGAGRRWRPGARRSDGRPGAMSAPRSPGPWCSSPRRSSRWPG